MLSKFNKNESMSFSVLDKQGNTISPDDKGHVALSHEQVFMLKFVNPLNTRLQIDVYLNGKVGNTKAFVGTWILDPNQTSLLKTNKNKGGEFTFVRQYSSSFQETVENFVSEDDYGRLSVRFRDEQAQPPVTLSRAFSKGGIVPPYNLSYNSNVSYNAGGIALSGSSDQTFGTTHPIVKYGYVDSIYDVRLVEKVITSLYTSDAIPEHKYCI